MCVYDIYIYIYTCISIYMVFTAVDLDPGDLGTEARKRAPETRSPCGFAIENGCKGLPGGNPSLLRLLI